MIVYLYLGLLDRLLTRILPAIKSDSVKENETVFSLIALDAAKINKAIKPSDRMELITLYNEVLEKANFYFKAKDSEIRRGYLQKALIELRAKLLELILLDSNLTI